MKKFMVFALYLATAVSAMAETSLDTRMGYASASSNSLSSSTAQSTSGMAVHALRLKWKNQLAEGVTYKMRVNLIPFKPGAQGVGDGSYSNAGKGGAVMPGGTSLLLYGTPGNQPNDFINWAQFDVKLTDGLSLTVGRLADPGLLGFEGQEDSSYVPFLSQGVSVSSSLTGFEPVYSLDGKNSVGFVFANNTDATDTTRPAYGLFYVGKYGDLELRASYHFLPRNTSFNGKGLSNPPGDAGATPITLGAQYTFDDLKFIFDIHQISYPGLSSNGTNASTMTYLGRVFYTMGSFTPQFRLEGTSRQGLQTRSTDDVTDSVLNMALSFDYKKKPTDKMTYMFTVVSAATTYGSAGAYNIATSKDQVPGKNANVSGQFFYASLRYNGELQ